MRRRHRFARRPSPGKLCGLLLLAAAGLARPDAVVIQAEDLSGDWREQTNIAGYLGRGFRTSNARGVAETTLNGTVDVSHAGRWHVWARGFENRRGGRAFRLQIGEGLLEPTHRGKQVGWTWQRSGAVELPQGKVDLIVRDADKGFETVDAILLTDDAEHDPNADEERFRVLAGRKDRDKLAERALIAECHRVCSSRTVPASRAEWEARRGEIKQALIEGLGLDPWPERTPLNPRITGRTEHEGFIIENVIFESWPGFFVTANLFLPTGVEFPVPGVVCPIGHAMEEGKNSPSYQPAYIALAKQGLVALAYDAIGQGERRIPGNGHNRGFASLMLGRTNEGMMVWETMRALDYMLTRPEIDPECLGITGNSGGGENTFYTMPLEDRLAAGVSSCFVCSYDQFLRFGGQHCICNHLIGIIQHAEQWELIGLNAPRPFCFTNGAKDPIFPIAGVRDTAEKARAVYALYGAERDVLSLEFDCGHGWKEPLREAMYGWMAHHLQGRDDRDPQPEPPQELYPINAPEVNALKDGKLPPESETIVSLNRKLAREKARALKAAWGAPRSATALAQNVEELREKVRATLGGMPDVKPRAELAGAITDGGVVAEKILLRAEPKQIATGVLFRPADAAGPLDVVVTITEDDPYIARQQSLTRALVESGRARLVLNPRGTGETAGDEHILVTDSIMLGRHYFGQRVFDVLQMARYLRGRKALPARSITYHGARVGALLALYACALDEQARGAALEQPLASYELAFTNVQLWPISIFVPRIMEATDIPYLAAACVGKRLLIWAPLDGDLKRLEREGALKAFAVAESAFTVGGGELEIKCGGTANDVVGRFLLAPS